KIVALADLNHDHSIDLVWQNSKTGDVVYWPMNGPAWTGTYQYIVRNVTDLDWKIAGTADLNQDGTPGLIWQNSASGDVVYWFMNGPTWTGSYQYILRNILQP